MTKPDIAVGRTYAGARNDERIVLGLHMGTPPYGVAREWNPRTKAFEIRRGQILVPLVRYRHGTAPGNTERLRGREYVCTVASFRGWMRREVKS